MAEKHKKRGIELHSDEVEDILGRVPSWLVRNGFLILALFLVVIIAAGWFIRYPDIKHAAIVVTSVNPPAELEARSDGKITTLFVKDNDHVVTGDLIAIIENPASYEDVLRLKARLEDLNPVAADTSAGRLFEFENARFGTIQSDYSAFVKAYKNYIDFENLDYHNRRIQLLRAELDKHRIYSQSMSKRAEILEEEYNLMQRQFLRDATLYEQSVLSKSDLESSKAEMLSKRNNWQELLGQIAENNITISRTEEQILELELGQQDERRQLINSLEESFNKLKAAIDNWEHNYVLMAPVDGIVTFTRFWSENQNVKAGEKVLTIVPGVAGSMIGKINLPVEGAGEVRPGQQVNIKFANYPHLEYGMVKGFVGNISKVPDDAFYTVEVTLPEGLTTYYGIEIDFNQNMQGQAEILTDKMRFIERVFNPIRSALTRQAEM
ncbi:MAG: HlyD family efflux transporter periplasmic adaptor subunit [Bacteroidales bacterium]|nr:HlyD family efflux transporter periplasmic adaptor subunit [Bacteroidales bacterium]